MVAALWMPMGRALKSPTGACPVGLVRSGVAFFGVAPFLPLLIVVVFRDGGSGGFLVNDGLARGVGGDEGL